MRVVIMGSGRTGSLLACLLSRAGHDVTVIDWSESAFDRLPDDFPGKTVLGNAVDQETLQLAGLESADVFVAATSGDNRNIMASEIARTVFEVPRVISRVKDPNRAGIFKKLGIEVDCRTTEGAEVILRAVGEEELLRV
jgi:trk system potassium uptake protein TrkA